MPVEMQKEWARCGAFIEHNWLQIATGESSWELALSEINAIGPEHTIVSSDGGQTTSIPPDEAIMAWCRKLAETGYPEREIRRIVSENTAFLAESL